MKSRLNRTQIGGLTFAFEAKLAAIQILVVERLFMQSRQPALSMGLTTHGGFEYFFRRGEGIDFRLDQVDREHVKEGDLIEFLEDPGEKRRYLVELVKIYRARSFSQLIDFLPNSFPEKVDKENIIQSLREWWSPADETKRGVVGYYVKVASEMLQ